MATLHVRNVPDLLYASLRARAEQNGRSIGAEAIQLLQEQLAGETERRGWMARRRRGGGVVRGGLFHRFTGLARQAVVRAHDEARALGHDHIGTGHLLLGVLGVEAGTGARALASLGLELDHARSELERLVGRGEGAPAGRIPFRPEAKKALELALREALALHCDYLGTEHLVLGILREGEAAGAQILAAVEPDPEKIRACVRRAMPPVADVFTEPSHFRVVDLEGTAETWEQHLNDAAAKGYELVEIVDGRAIFTRP